MYCRKRFTNENFDGVISRQIAVAAALIVAISDIAKRITLIAAVLASAPLTSVLSVVWLYIDTNDTAKVTTPAGSVFRLVLPSLALFLGLQLLIMHGPGFYTITGIAMTITAARFWPVVTGLGLFENEQQAGNPGWNGEAWKRGYATGNSQDPVQAMADVRFPGPLNSLLPAGKATPPESTEFLQKIASQRVLK